MKCSKRACVFVALGLLALLLAGLMKGCAINPMNYLGGTRSDGYRPLIERGSAEDAYVRLEAMTAEMRAALTAEFGYEWSPGSTSTFDAVSNENGESVGEFFALALHPVHWLLLGSVAQSRADKDRVLEILGPIGRKYGFSDPVVFRDRDGEDPAFGLVAHNADGDTYELGSRDYTPLSYTGAGRLSRADLAELGKAP